MCLEKVGERHTKKRKRKKDMFIVDDVCVNGGHSPISLSVGCNKHRYIHFEKSFKETDTQWLALTV